MPPSIKSPRKLIEVALPLDAINDACKREKSIRHGHPSTLHLWWARRPLAAARAVIFAQMVNDPGYQQGDGFKYGVNKEAAAKRREELFGLIKDLVKWENSNDPEVLGRARAEIRRSWREVCELNRDHPRAAELFDPERLPAFHDPFAGGGALPLEAQRLGLESHASDLNPVAVTINKAMIEIPPRFAGRPPVSRVHAEGKRTLGMDGSWPGASGLAEDVRYYGEWMRTEAAKRIGRYYPKVKVTAGMAEEQPELAAYVGEELTVIAWLWARTVKSPNPAFSHVDVPLVSSFVLSSKEGKEAYVQPVVEGDRYRFTVRKGVPPDGADKGTKLARGANFRCLLSDTAIEGDYIKAEGCAGRSGARLMAVVVEGQSGRIYLSPQAGMEEIAKSASPIWKPDLKLPDDLRAFWTPSYGITHYYHLFTQRQLLALNTFSDLIQEAMAKVRQDASESGLAADGESFDQGGSGAKAYAEAVGVYLAFALDRLAMTGNSLVRWNCVGEKAQHCFGRQALPMLWDFAEVNVLGSATGCLNSAVFYAYDPLRELPVYPKGKGLQLDAQTQTVSANKVISTDPPYYDNIGYADLSDFFYVWLRRNLRPIFPGLYATLSVPKAEELVATPYRHGTKAKAEHFFLDGMTAAMHNLAEQAHPAFPVTIYYAFKQSETQEKEGTSSTGWETFLEAVLAAGFAIVGTWPMRSELENRMIASGTNALASSIILVCRKRPADAPTLSRREFIRELNVSMPDALEAMTVGAEHSPVAPVDLAQAMIGPGMAIFSKYAAVLEANGARMSVKSALRLINRFLSEDDFDHDTQFCLDWFEGFDWRENAFGQADTLARAKGTSVGGCQEAGVLKSEGGKVRLLKWTEYPAGWNPATDTRTPVWEVLHHLIRTLDREGSAGAGRLLAATSKMSDPVRALAYRLYTLCERKKLAEDARAYNSLMVSWSAIESEALKVQAQSTPIQGELDMG